MGLSLTLSGWIIVNKQHFWMIEFWMNVVTLHKCLTFKQVSWKFHEKGTHLVLTQRMTKISTPYHIWLHLLAIFLPWNKMCIIFLIIRSKTVTKLCY